MRESALPTPGCILRSAGKYLSVNQRLSRPNVLGGALFTCLVCCLTLACSDAGTEAEESAHSSSINFELLLPDRTGLHSAPSIVEDATRNYFLFNYLYVGGGAAAADFNGDGLQDLYVVNNNDSSHLYLNQGDFRFKDVSVASGTSLPGMFKNGVTVVDINQDGLPDLYQCVSGEPGQDIRNRLLVNQGDGTFEEQAAAYGLDLANPSTTATFFDYDRDGDLDAFIASRPIDYSSNDRVRIEEVDGRRQRVRRVNDPIDSDVFLRNDGGRFVDVTAAVGMVDRAFTLSVSVADLNGDHWPDVFVANDYIEPDALYLNNQDGTFRRLETDALGHMAHSSMGSNVGDLDNDGHFDLMVLDMLAEGHERQMRNSTAMRFSRYRTLSAYGYGKQVARNMLYTGKGDGQFQEVACLAGVYQTDWSWGPLFTDVDNDQRPDIFVTNGFRRDISDMDFTSYTLDSLVKAGLSQQRLPEALAYVPSTKQPNYLYHNQGQLRFRNVNAIAGMEHPTFSNGAVAADFDQDGRVDFAVHNFEDPVFLYRNDSEAGNHLSLTLKGKAPNIDATGAEILVRAGGTVQRLTAQPSRGFFSSQPKQLHIGLGTQAAADSVEIWWPDGSYSLLTSLQGSVSIDQATATAAPIARQDPQAQLFSEPQKLAVRHNENDFAQFQSDPLLYRTLDAEGPIVATGDVNGDGLVDAYLGASFGESGKLLLSGPTEPRIDSSAFMQDRQFEDGCAAFFDIDGDGDLDLFVGSSGVAVEETGGSLVDRVYINDGSGSLTRDEYRLPRMAWHTTACAAIDVNADGALDMVTGSLGNLRNFPKQEPNHILINKGGTLQDETAAVCADWATYGMVQDLAVHQPTPTDPAELLAVGEWTSVARLTPTPGGKLDLQVVDGPGAGLYFSVASGDFNGDGFSDFVAGNLGLNTRLLANSDAPLTLPVLDYDGNGKLDPVVYGRKDGDREMPYTRREVLVRQVPAFAKTYPRFVKYARADKAELLAGRAPEQLSVTELAHQVCYGSSSGYRCEALDRSAQVSALRDLQVLDLNGDGIDDLLGVGNIYGMEIIGGPLDAGRGVVQLGSKTGLQAVDPARSGLWLTGDLRSIGVLGSTSDRRALVGRNDGPWTIQRIR